MKKIKYLFITLFLVVSSVSFSTQKQVTMQQATPQPQAIVQEAVKWTIDKPHCFVNFAIGHMFSTVVGRFKDFEGEFNLDPSNLEGGKMNFRVLVNSIETDTEARNKHLKTADFFDAQKYPYITFTSTKISKQSKNKYKLYGKLTIKDVTRDVVLPLKVTGLAESAMVPGVMVLSFYIDTVIKRSDYGVGAGKWALTNIIGDEARLFIPMELNRPMK